MEQNKVKLVVIVAIVLAIGAFIAYKFSTKDASDAVPEAAIQNATTQTETSSAMSNEASSSGALDLTTDASGLSKSAVVVKTSKGILKFKFYSKDAPNTTKRFAELVQSKFYNGLAFHRVVPGFVVQGGDPKSKNKSDPMVGTGGSGQKQKAEFNSRKHVRGAVAMARSQDPDSADSQFYFCLNAFPHLDGNYTVIGQLVDYGAKVDGKDVLDRLTQWDEIVEMKIE